MSEMERESTTAASNSKDDIPQQKIREDLVSFFRIFIILMRILSWISS